MRHTWTSLALGIATVSATFIATESTALCQRGGQRGGAGGWEFVAKKYDANKDNKVSAEEYTRGAEAFKALDKDKDGLITQSDWAGGGRGRGDRGTAPQVGQVAPDFALSHVSDPDKQATLSSFAGKKPVALIFGSCT